MPLLAGVGGIIAKEAEGAGTPLDPCGISFRPLRAPDLALMHRWLNAPHVRRWWYGEGTSYREIEEKYAPRIGGQGPVRPFVILHEDTPIGYIQGYPTSHDERYGSLVGVEGSAGMDLFIGEAEYLHRGLGVTILRLFLAGQIFSDPAVEACVIGPEPGNVAAIRAYEKAGFRFFKEILLPGEPEPERLLKLTRAEFEGSDVG